MNGYVTMPILGNRVGKLSGIGASAKSYVVSPAGSDANTGTTDAPFATIAKALSTASARDTVYLRGGTYAERVVINKRVTLKAWDSESVTIRPNASEKTEVMLVRDVDHFTLDGVVIDAINTRRGISINNSQDAFPITHNIQLLNFEVKNCIGHNPGERGQGVIITGKVSDVLLQDCYIHDVSAQGVDADYAHGVYASCDGLVIRRGHFSDMSCNGVHFYGSGDGTCLVEQCWFERCVIPIGFYTGDCIARNNVTRGKGVHLMARYDVKSARFYHNTCIGDGVSPLPLGLGAQNFYSAAAYTEAKNNVFVGLDQAIVANPNLGTVLCEYNLRSNVTKADQVETGATVSSINATFAPITDDGAAGVKPTAGNPAIGAGVWLADVTTDYAGNARSNPPTLGAWEAA